MFIRPIWLLLCGVLSVLTPLRQSHAQQTGQPEVLPQGVERVLYIPLDPEDPELNPRLVRQETSIIARYFREAELAEEISPVSVLSPSLFRAVESGLVMEARDARCADGKGDTLFTKLDSARKEIQGENFKKAGDLLTDAREALSCAGRKIGRGQLAELFLFTGIVALDAGRTEEGERWIRSGLSVDEELKSSTAIPPRFISEMERLAFEAERSPKVDARLSPEQGELWNPRNLVIDGRRMIFDRMFLELVPGYHYVQVSLPDGSSWGALLTLESGQIYDVIEGIRASLNLRPLYLDQMTKAVDTGTASPALQQGLRMYTKTLRREQIYLSRLFPKESGAELMVRRFHVERGLEVPEEMMALAPDPSTAWVPVRFAPPWATDLTFGFSQVQTAALDYRSSGLGLEFNGRYLLARQFYLGGSVGGGVRFSKEVGDDATEGMNAGPDLAASVYGGIDIPLGAASVRVDVGYLRQLYALQNVAYGCQLSDTSGSGELLYACSEDLPVDGSEVPGEAQTPIPFSFQSLTGGPRFRLTLVFTPFKGQGVQLQGLLRAGYTPLLLNLPAQGTGVVGGQEVLYQFVDGSNQQILHRLDVNFGLSAAF